LLPCSKVTDYATSAMLHYYSTSDPVLHMINFVVSHLVCKQLLFDPLLPLVGKTAAYPSQHQLTNTYQYQCFHSSLKSITFMSMKFQRWLDSFQALFSRKCTKCGFHLKEDTDGSPIPPCWRAYDTLQPYHYRCYIKLSN
jgi:hypothetical protein